MLTGKDNTNFCLRQSMTQINAFSDTFSKSITSSNFHSFLDLHWTLTSLLDWEAFWSCSYQTHEYKTIIN